MLCIYFQKEGRIWSTTRETLCLLESGGARQHSSSTLRMTKGFGKRKRRAESKAWSKKNHKWIIRDTNPGHVASSTDGVSPSLENYSCLGENKNPVRDIK